MTSGTAGDWSMLLASIGAVPSTWRYAGQQVRSAPAWQITLAQTGIDVSIDQVEIDQGTGLYLYKGQQVLIYIKFTRRPREVLEHDKSNSPRFHFRDCKTIQDMKERDRFQRYVAISRTDGYFPVVSEEQFGGNHELEARLGPCKWCLRETDYQGYARADKRKQHRIWDQFSIEAFFATFSSSISSIPIDSCSAVDPDEYAPDWAAKSFEIRERAGWKCDGCKVSLLTHKRLLHAHHVDRDKQNNWRYNLRPLCKLCHRAQPGHKTMYVSFAETETIRRLRTEQGLQAE